MAQDYVVNYQINVNNQKALDAIRQFSQATQQMEGLVRRFDSITKGIGKVNSALASLRSKPITINIDTQKAQANVETLRKTLHQLNREINTFNRKTTTAKANTGNAQKSLDALLKKINQIKANGKLVITASAAGASGAVGGSSRATTTGAIIRSGGSSRNLYPTNRSVLGPMYYGQGTSVAAEMIKGMGVAYGLSSFMQGITGVFKDATAYENISQTTKNILATHDKQPNFEGRWNDVNKLMRQVGVETKYTAPQVASAGKFLAMAGLDLNQIRSSINPISNIALVGDTDLGETADLMTNIMTGYQIPANQMNRAADILTMTFTKSNTTLTTLAESFKYAGTVAHQAGIDFSTASAALGVLGDAGIQGSHAGTTLRMMLLNIQNPTKKAAEAWKELGVETKDAHGNMRNLVDILEDLNKKRQQMSQGDFATLIGKMFRVTAAPGALALIQNADKVREVTGLNKDESFGLAGKLADEKKNTIEGLWYQMTSAFTESGMQGFEQMQGAIRDFLKRMIALMKSPDFAEALRSGMETFLKLVDVVADVFKGIMKFWNILPDWAKTGFVQFVKLQMTINLIAAASKSVLSTWVMIKGVAMGQWLSRWFLQPIASAFVYMTSLYRIQRNIVGLGVGKALWATAVGTGTRLTRMARGVFGGAEMVAGSVMGATVGAGANGATRAVAGAAGMSLFGALKGITGFLLTNPYGWATLAVAGIAAVGYQIYDTYQKTKAAREANEAWAESYRKVGVDKLNMSEADALVISNMRLFNDNMLSQSEKLQASADAWHRYWIERNGPEKKTDDKTIFADTDAGADFKKLLEGADAWFGQQDAFAPIVKGIGGKFTTKMLPSSSYDAYGNPIEQLANGVELNGRFIPFSGRNMDENAAVQVLLARVGADKNNERYRALESYLFANASAANSYTDFQKIIAGARAQFIPRVFSHTWDNISSETAGKMSWGDVQSSQAYVLALSDNMKALIQTWYDWGNILKDVDAGNNVDFRRVQTVMQERFGPLFDLSHGIFGTDSWIQNVKKIYENPTAFGLDKNASVAEISGYINKTFDDILNWYNTLDTKYRPLFASFIWRDPFAGIMNGRGTLNEGGITGGTRIGETRNIDGKTYIWSNKPPFATPQWVDSKGNVYVPKNSKSTLDTQIYSGSGNKRWGAGGAGKNKKNWTSSLHNGTDQSKYKSHNTDHSAVPKQVIVHIQNLLKIDKQQIDWNNPQQVAAVENIKQRMAEALLDVVQDFNANIV